MNSINDLYRQVIVEHYKNTRNKGLKEGAEYRSLRLKNPSCGDDVTIQIKTNDNIDE
jgi:NifU-like protein involved in Fe-S cluster formation